MTKECFKEPGQVVRLWLHECERVLADRLVNEADLAKFADMRVAASRKYFADVPQARSRQPILRYCCLLSWFESHL